MSLQQNSSNSNSHSINSGNSTDNTIENAHRPESNETELNSDRSKTILLPEATAESEQKTILSTSEDLKPTEEDSQSEGKTNLFKKYWWLALLGVLLVGGVAVWQPWSNTSEEAVTETEPVRLSVRTAKAKREPIRAWVSSEGNVQAINYKHLAFEVEGDVTYIADRNGRELREGDRVTAGELLASVDDRELLADVSQARAGDR